MLVEVEENESEVNTSYLNRLQMCRLDKPLTMPGTAKSGAA